MSPWRCLVGGRSAEPEGAQTALGSACTAPKGPGHSGSVWEARARS